jgi:hypothetical protein
MLQSNYDTPYYLLGGLVPALFLLSKSSLSFGPYFSFEDVVKSNTASENGLESEQRQISQANIKNAQRLAREVLTPAVNFLGEKFTINSWYRSDKVNDLVGGADNSTHLKARASDAKYIKNGQRRNDLLARAFLQRSNFDRMLLEKGPKENPIWIHIETARAGQAARRKIMYTPDGVNWQNVSHIEALALFG